MTRRFRFHRWIPTAAPSLCAAVLFCAPALADDQELFATLQWQGSGNVTQLEPGHTVLFGAAGGRMVDSGNSENGPNGGMLDSLSANCQILIELQGEARSPYLFTSGYCTLTGGGDALYLQWSCVGRDDRCEGGWYMTGGTGRFTGARGDGEILIDGIVGADAGPVSGAASMYGFYNFELAAGR
jgi:hypothetical protein